MAATSNSGEDQTLSYHLSLFRFELLQSLSSSNPRYSSLTPSTNRPFSVSQPLPNSQQSPLIQPHWDDSYSQITLNVGNQEMTSPLERLYKKFSKRKSESSEKLQVEEDEAISNSSSGGSSLNVEELRSVFDYMDTNSDGKIFGEELQSCVSLLGGALSLSEAEEVVRVSNVDRDGFIDFEEFLKLIEGEDCSDEERRRELSLNRIFD